MALTTTTEQEVKLLPTVRAKLRRALKTYQELHGQKKALELAMDKQKGEIEAIRESVGAASFDFEGFKVSLVAGLRKKFNLKKYISIGGDLGLYNEANEDVPVKTYTKVTIPGDKSEDA